MTVRIAVVCESEADFRTGTGLLDRVCRESEQWIADLDSLNHVREFVGTDDSTVYWPWKKLDDIARMHNVRVRGHFDGKPGQPDARAARRAILVLELIHRNLSAIVLLRDVDNQPERSEGLQQARNEAHSTIIAIGLANRCREAWVLAGFEPSTECEIQTHAEQKELLSFDPCIQSERLQNNEDGHYRNPKVVLSHLVGDDPPRQARCWELTSLDTLRERGQNNGLAEYLHEVDERLVPLIRGH